VQEVGEEEEKDTEGEEDAEEGKGPGRSQVGRSRCWVDQRRATHRQLWLIRSGPESAEVVGGAGRSMARYRYGGNTGALSRARGRRHSNNSSRGPGRLTRRARGRVRGRGRITRRGRVKDRGRGRGRTTCTCTGRDRGPRGRTTCTEQEKVEEAGVEEGGRVRGRSTGARRGTGAGLECKWARWS